MEAALENRCVSVLDEQQMGRVIVEIELSNSTDEELKRRDPSAPEVRKIKQKVLVDTGATMLSIPEDQIAKLGLPVLRQATSRYADGRREVRNVYGPAIVKILNRTGAVEVLAGHIGQPALLGQIPLEGLDLLVDPRRQRLIANPESPDMPMVDLMTFTTSPPPDGV